MNTETSTFAVVNDPRAKSWNRLVGQLLVWNRSPSQADEDGLESPSLAAIHRTFEFLFLMAAQSTPVPDQMVSDGEGGIVLERTSEAPNAVERLEVDSEGAAELLKFQQHKLVSRIPVPLPDENPARRTA